MRERLGARARVPISLLCVVAADTSTSVDGGHERCRRSKTASLGVARRSSTGEQSDVERIIGDATRSHVHVADERFVTSKLAPRRAPEDPRRKGFKPRPLFRATRPSPSFPVLSCPFQSPPVLSPNTAHVPERELSARLARDRWDDTSRRESDALRALSNRLQDSRGSE